jgi:hypothetical protein
MQIKKNYNFNDLIGLITHSSSEIKVLLALSLTLILVSGVFKLFEDFYHKIDFIDKNGKPGVLVDKNGKPLKYGPSSPTPPDYEEEDDDDRKRRQKITARLVAGAVVLAYVINVIVSYFS